jgi:rubrerythrin
MNANNSEKLVELLNQTIELERNAGRIYLSFSEQFPDDHAFWWQIGMEEENHASLIRSGRDYFLSKNLFPVDLVCKHMNLLEDVNKKLIAFYEKNKKEPVTRDVACNFALWIETSAGEFHFQSAISKVADSRALDMFQKLNKDDKDHALRLKIFMQKNGIKENLGLVRGGSL